MPIALTKKESDIITAIFVVLVIVYLLWIFVINPIVNWMAKNILLMGITFGIILLGVFLILWKRKKELREQENAARIRDEIERQKRRKYEAEQKAKGLESYLRSDKEVWGTPAQIAEWKRADAETKQKESEYNQLVTAIKAFKPVRKYEYEQPYHDNLYSFLNAKFPGIKHEHQEGSSRPDILFGRIAIEVKGPTDNQALDTLTTKYLKYRGHFERVIFVLFDPRYSTSHFNEIKKGIQRDWPEAEIIVIPM